MTWTVPAGMASGASSAVTSPAAPAPSASSGAAQPASRGTGVAVLATDGATDAAWRLATRLYRGPLRPRALDEAHARALAGEAPAPGAPRDLQDLYETRAAIHGDDAPSRRLLASLAESLGVAALVVVSRDPSGAATARVYLAASGGFDAARYGEDAGGGASPWEPTAASLERALRAPEVPAREEPQAKPGADALTPVPPAKSAEPAPDGAKPFYKSPWFWGALGAAVFGGGAIYLATQSNTDSGGPMHVQLKVPR